MSEKVYRIVNLFNNAMGNIALGITALMVSGFLSGLFIRSFIRYFDADDAPSGYTSIILVIFTIISAFFGILFAAPDSISFHNYEAALFCWGAFSIQLGYIIKAFGEDQ